MVRIPWGGNQHIKIELPEGWRLIGELLPNPLPPVPDLAKATKHELACPIGKKTLRDHNLKGKRVTVVIDDYTRPTPVAVLFQCVQEELMLAGADLSNITVLVAAGTHRPMTCEEIKERLGLPDLDEVRTINHNCHVADQLITLPQDDVAFPVMLNRHVVVSDLVVLIGTVEPHPLAGFSGGLKNIIPGCAAVETIAGTHLSGTAETRFRSVGLMGEECSSRTNLERAALLIPGEYFLVNTVLNPDGQVAGVFCGDVIEAHRQACKMAKQIYGVQVREKSDAVLLGSHPMDSDFWQGTKSFSFGKFAVKKGGVLIAFLYCREGIGGLALPPAFLPKRLTKLCLGACTTDEWVDLRERITGKMGFYTRFMVEILTETARHCHLLVYSPNLPGELAEKLGVIEVFDQMHALMARASELVPKSATVYSLPYGGATYTISG